MGSSAETDSSFGLGTVVADERHVVQCRIGDRSRFNCLAVVVTFEKTVA